MQRDQVSCPFLQLGTRELVTALSALKLQGLPYLCRATETSLPVGSSSATLPTQGAEKSGHEAFFRTSYLNEPTKTQGSPVGFGCAYKLDLFIQSFTIIP